jgi:hypothetical protein
MISTYLVDLFRGLPGGRTVKLTVFAERSGKKRSTRIEYTGPAEGLRDLAPIIQKAVDDD